MSAKAIGAASNVNGIALRGASACADDTNTVTIEVKRPGPRGLLPRSLRWVERGTRRVVHATARAGIRRGHHINNQATCHRRWPGGGPHHPSAILEFARERLNRRPGWRGRPSVRNRHTDDRKWPTRRRNRAARPGDCPARVTTLGVVRHDRAGETGRAHRRILRKGRVSKTLPAAGPIR